MIIVEISYILYLILLISFPAVRKKQEQLGDMLTERLWVKSINSVKCFEKSQAGVAAAVMAPAAAGFVSLEYMLTESGRDSTLTQTDYKHPFALFSLTSIITGNNKTLAVTNT